MTHSKIARKLFSVSLIVTILFTVMSMGALTVNAANQDDLTFTLSSDGTYYSVTDCKTTAAGTVVVPSSYNGKPVTKISDSAFYGCSSLTSITIPTSVTSIGSSAFRGCTSLERISLPFVGSSKTDNNSYSAVFGYIFGYTRRSSSSSYSDTTYQYSYNSYYYHYYIPASLKSVTITAATQIPYKAFYNCKRITSISIPSTVTTINDYAFYYCSNLLSISIPKNVTSIKPYTFYNCIALSSITIPNGVTEIGDHAFYSCSNLSSISIPKTVTAIGPYAFYYCSQLTSLTIPNSVTSIGNFAFRSCSKLENITLPFVGASRTSGGYSAVLGYIFGYEKTNYSNYSGATNQYYDSSYYYHYYIPSSLKSVTITDATQIPYRAFYNCTNIRKIGFPNTVTTIGSYAFYNCQNLEGVYYGGSQTEKNDITINSNNDYLNNAYWYCNRCITHTYHSYTNDCDTSCNVCERLRTVPHVYTNSCDTTCNACSATRTITHTYDNSCDTTCNVCKATRKITHTYDNSCDAECNICKYKRTPGKHTALYPATSAVTTNNNSYYYFQVNSDGIYSSTNHSSSSTSTFTITATESCKLDISYYTSTEKNYDKLIIQHNSTTKVTESGLTSWNTLKLDLSKGDVVTIKYTKDSSGSSNEDTVYFKFTPYQTVTWGSVKLNCEVTAHCTICNKLLKSASEHTYSTNYDTQCNVCPQTRTVDSKTATYGVFTYRIDPDENGGTITITDVDSTASGKISFPAKLSSIPVTSIGQSAFSDCTKITGITIPASVKTIGSNAFKGCTGLNSVTIPKSVTSIGQYAFEGCTGLNSVYITDVKAWCQLSFQNAYANPLYYADDFYVNGKTTTSIAIPSGTKSIGDFAFYNYESLAKITIPGSVTSIGKSAFYNCSRLTSLSIPDSVETLGRYMLSGCTGLLELKIPFAPSPFAFLFSEEQYEISNDLVPRSIKQVTISQGYIPENAFSGCDNISIVVIGDKVTGIGNSAFLSCNSITKVTIGNGVETIGSCAFKECVSLTQITIGKSVKTIGAEAFKNCESILRVTIPNSVTKIKDNAFENCYSLGTLTLGSKVDQIGNFAFCNCYNLTKLTIPNSTTLIGSHAFQYCYNIKKATFGKNVTTIFDYAFYGCSALDNISLPNSATSIGEYAFSNCSALKRATIRGRTNHINNGTFEGCTSLMTVAFPKNVTTIAYNAFNSCNNLKEVWYEGTKANKSNILFAAGNTSIQNAKWLYSSFDTVNHKYSYACDEECDICGETHTSDKHKSDGGKVTKKATYTSTGTKVYKCTVCGKTIKTVTLPKLKLATPKLNKIENTTSGVKVTWGKVSGADNYVVYRKTYNAKTQKWSGWSKLSTGVVNTTYLDKGVKSGTYYRYTVRASNKGGLSGFDTSGIKTYFLSTPKISSAANVSNGITIKWNKITGANGYIVYRKTTGGWAKIATVKGNGSVSYTDKTATAGVTYKYTIRAYYGSYRSWYNSNGTTVKRLTNPTLKSVSSAKSGVTLKWNKVTGATGYIVYRKTDNGSWQKIATLSGNTRINYLDKTAKKGTTYTYTVRAYYGSTFSAYNTKGLTIKDKY